MLIDDTNELLRNCINELINSGWLKTHIGKVLLGPNGQAHLNHFLKDEDGELPNNFGIKPLQKVGQVIGYDAHVVFIHPGDDAAVDGALACNQKFVNELVEKLVAHLSDNTQKVNAPKGKSQIDNVLDELLPE